MTKTPKKTYQLKQKGQSHQHLEYLNFSDVDPLSVLSDYYTNHKMIVPPKGTIPIEKTSLLEQKKEIKIAKRYIKLHLHRTITLEETANKVFLSPYYFSKLFKSEVGITFIAYVNHQKMIHASELLRNSDLTISHIAQSLGFTQMSYFSKTFKKEFEMTPKEYRKNPTS